MLFSGICSRCCWLLVKTFQSLEMYYLLLKAGEKQTTGVAMMGQILSDGAITPNFNFFFCIYNIIIVFSRRYKALFVISLFLYNA